MALAKAILQKLSVQSLSRTVLEKRVLKEYEGSHATFEGMFQCLFRMGCIEKSSGAHLAPYRITLVGRKFLEGLP